jgi:hypothetical protein
MIDYSDDALCDTDDVTAIRNTTKTLPLSLSLSLSLLSHGG